jgi:hypothetical protein
MVSVRRKFLVATNRGELRARTKGIEFAAIGVSIRALWLSAFIQIALRHAGG